MGASKGLSSPMEILQAALKKEEAARRFYDELANNTHVEAVRGLVAVLRDEEHRHVKLIQDKIVELRLG
ncbi:MAG: ferritin family protein [bacterium]|jgi:rubrerythrin